MVNIEKIEKNIDNINTESMFIYFTLLKIFDEHQIDNNEFVEKLNKDYDFTKKFKEHIVKKIENGESIK